MNDAAVIDLAVDGTSEEVWLPVCAGLPTWSLDCPRLVVVAPHPDDETLAAGGLIHTAAAAGVLVTVLAASDGEAADPDAGADARATLARRRAAEQRAALDRLGAGIELVRLGLPDGDLTGHQAALTAAAADHLDAGAAVVGTWRHDGHPDHEAAGRAAAAAADQTGSLLVEVPVWAWHWADPAQLPLGAARRLPLPAGARRAKADALACHASQLGTILPAAVLQRFRRPFEVVFP